MSFFSAFIFFIDFFFFSSRRRHTRCYRDWSSDVCSSDLLGLAGNQERERPRIARDVGSLQLGLGIGDLIRHHAVIEKIPERPGLDGEIDVLGEDRKSTRLNSSHGSISYAVFCLKKKQIKQ